MKEEGTRNLKDELRKSSLSRGDGDSKNDINTSKYSSQTSSKRENKNEGISNLKNKNEVTAGNLKNKTEVKKTEAHRNLKNEIANYLKSKEKQNEVASNLKNVNKENINNTNLLKEITEKKQLIQLNLSKCKNAIEEKRTMLKLLEDKNFEDTDFIDKILRIDEDYTQLHRSESSCQNAFTHIETEPLNESCISTNTVYVRKKLKKAYFNI